MRFALNLSRRRTRDEGEDIPACTGVEYRLVFASNRLVIWYAKQFERETFESIGGAFESIYKPLCYSTILIAMQGVRSTK